MNPVNTRDFMPRYDKITNAMKVGAVGGVIGVAVLTMDESVSMSKLLKLVGGAVTGGLVGLLTMNAANRNDPRKW